MPDSQSHTPPSAPSATDRRVAARYPVRPTEYIEIGENNGGIILDISEGGMAVATAQALVGNQTLRFRFQLPRFPETIETAGEIHWIGETKKRAGVRFVELPSAAHELIQKWINLQSRNGTAKDTILAPSPAPASAPSTELTQEEDVQEKFSAANGDASSEMSIPAPSALDEPETDDPENYPPIYESPNARAAKDPLPERRSQARRLMSTSTYVQLDDGNGGLISDLSESGFSFRAAKTLEHDQLFVRFQLPGSAVFIETPAWIVWKSASKKKAGARFGALPDDATKQIYEWIGLQAPSVNAATQPEKSSTPKVPAAIASPTPDSIPVSQYIAPSVRKASPPPTAAAMFPTLSSLTQSAASPSKSSTSGLTPASTNARAAAAAASTGAAPLAAPPAPKLVKPLSTLEAAAVLPTAPFSSPSSPLSPLKSMPPVTPGPVISREFLTDVEPPFHASSASSLFPNDVPVVPAAESSWYIAPKRRLSVWQIAALILVIGVPSFGAGILYYRNHQVTTSASESSRRTIEASNATRTSQPAPTDLAADADRPAAKLSSIPSPVTAPFSTVKDDQTRPTRDLSSQNADQQFADEPRQYVDQPRAKSSQPTQSAASPIRSDRDPANQAPRTTNQVASTRSNLPSSSDSLSPAQNAATSPPSQTYPDSNAVSKPRAPDTTAHRDPDSQPTASSNVPSPQDSQSVDRVATRSQSAPTSTPIAAAPATPPPAENPVGTVAFFPRFRSIRSPADSSSPSSKSGGVLQIGALQSTPAPAYPPEALHQLIQGLVELNVIVGTDGNVQTVHLVKGPAELATVAMNAVRGWHFNQTTLGGRPVQTEQSVYFTFKIGR